MEKEDKRFWLKIGALFVGFIILIIVINRIFDPLIDPVNPNSKLFAGIGLLLAILSAIGFYYVFYLILKSAEKQKVLA